MRSRDKIPLTRRLAHRSLVSLGALALTMMSFLVLPVIQAITQKPAEDVQVREANAVNLPPPPDVFEEEPEEEEPPEEEPPELKPDLQPLDLAQLELALNPGFGEGLAGPGDFTIDLSSLGGGGDVDEIFGNDDLDSVARATYKPLPNITGKLRGLGGGTVYVLLIIDEKGRVEEATIQSSPHPAYEAPVLAVVKKWRFEPGKRKGKPVRSRARAPITFPEG